MEILDCYLQAAGHVHIRGDGSFAHSLAHAALHTLEHCWYMLPVLFAVYLMIELIGHKATGKLKGALSRPTIGVVAGSALGLVPACGFSVAAANLYSERLISAGVVAAVFAATSDEALPIILAGGESAAWFLPLILIKFVFAILVGCIVNLVFNLTGLDRAHSHDTHKHHRHSEHVHEAGEHHHCSHCDSGKGILRTAALRSVSVFAFVLVTAFLVNLAIEMLGEDKLGSLLLSNSALQPFLAALIGLIPNCSASVVAAELFATGALGFGSLVSALSAGCGLGMLVLFRVNRNMKQNFALLAMLYSFSALLGVIIEVIL